MFDGVGLYPFLYSTIFPFLFFLYIGWYCGPVPPGRSKLSPLVHQARSMLSPLVHQARSMLSPLVHQALSKLSPLVHQAGSKLSFP